MTNTLQKTPPCSFCISPCVFWAVESKKHSCKHFHLYQVNSGGQICCIGITYTRAFLPAPPGDGKDGSSGCPATPAGLGAGGLQAGRPCPGGFKHEQRKSICGSYHAISGHLFQRERETTWVGQFLILLITGTDLQERQEIVPVPKI